MTGFVEPELALRTIRFGWMAPRKLEASGQS